VAWQSRGKLTLKEFTVRSFAQLYNVSMPTARRHLKELVREGKATTLQRPLRMRYYGREVETIRTVTTYSVK
jgi:DNA-binding transcriptional ArsR family regulator